MVEDGGWTDAACGPRQEDGRVNRRDAMNAEKTLIRISATTSYLRLKCPQEFTPSPEISGDSRTNGHKFTNSMTSLGGHTSGKVSTGIPNWRSSVCLRGSVALVAGVTCLVTFPLTGCVSKSKAEAQARAAFFAGQRQAVEMVQRAQAMGLTVTVLGPVRNPTIPWTNELTLAKALIAANYFGRTDPSEILVERNGQATTYDPKKLLNGEDVPLQPRDIIDIRQ